jgi:single-strand DNA-binding protein
VSATDITVIGNVVNSPTRNRTQNGSVTNFRVASTERRFDSATQEWTDGPSFFVDVECWGELGGNVAHTLSKGDPVVVVGVIRTSEWESDQGRRSRPQIKAEAVAPNLARGTADFRRTTRAATSVEPAAPQDVGLPGTAEDGPAGGDYEGTGQALDPLDAADLTAQPVHA